MTTAETVAESYDHYIERRAKIRAEIQERLTTELEAAMEVELRQLSRALHEAWAEGVTKTELRQATRQHSNAPGFRKLWDAAADEYPNERIATGGRPRLEAEVGATPKARKKETWVVDEASHTLTIEPVEGETLRYNVIYNETFGWIVDLKWATPEFAFHKEYGREAFETQLAPMTQDWELPAEDPEEGEL